MVNKVKSVFSKRKGCIFPRQAGLAGFTGEHKVRPNRFKRQHYEKEI